MGKDSSSILCCMCGDLGLQKELFQCKFCFFRSQHKYCSDLYPREEVHHTCNWCLREKVGSTISHNKTDKNETSKQSFEIDNGESSTKLIRREYSSQCNKPIKKKKDDKKPMRILIRRSGLKEMEPKLKIRAKQRFRPKARKYKLLEEVTR